MPLLPPLGPMFAAQRSAPPMPADLPPARLRAAMHEMIARSFSAFATVQAAVAEEYDVAIAVAGGEITLRVYRADTGAQAAPCHVLYHGGGFFLGTLDQSDGYCRALARGTGCVIVSVDYRLAPEYRFPTAVEDAYTALCHVAAEARELGIDAGRLSVGGASAGGNLAAVVAQLARDRVGPAIVAQLLEIPVTDFTSTRTLDFPAEDIAIAAAKSYAPLYLRDEADAHDPRASPLLAGSLEGLPPALVMCAEYDQLQPEGAAYAKRLAQAGVPTTYRLWPGQFHGSQGFDRIIPMEAAAYRADCIAFLREAHARR